MQARGNLDSDSPSDNISKFKVVVLGDQGVGKSALVWKFVYKGYEDKYLPTIGIDFFTKICYLDGIAVRLQIWDTAGQERFRCLIPSYLRDCHVVLVCFDVTNCCSLDNVPEWIELALKEKFGHTDDSLIILVGNKVDDKTNRQISYDCASSVAEVFRVPYVETSALTGYNVELLFRKIAKEMFVKDLERRQRGIRSRDRDLDVVEERVYVDRGVINLQTTYAEEQKTAIPKKRRSCKCS